MQFRRLAIVIPAMPAATSDRWIGWVASCLVTLLLTPYWAIWFHSSPMMELWNEVSANRSSPPERPGNRYFQSLVIAQGENHGYARCVLCSITVRGNLRQATTLWGDLTVESGGSVERADVYGGRITLMPGARVWMPTLFAYGGAVAVDESIRINSSLILSSPRSFYPGQRSWPGEGIAVFAIALLLTSACGGTLVWGHLSERIGEAVRRPVASALLGAVLFVLILPFLGFLTFVLLRILPPLALLLLFLTPVPYWIAFVIGFAAVTERLGLGLGLTRPLGARLGGAGVLIALMLIPIVGLLVMVPITLVALGAGTGILPLKGLETGSKAG
jgi:hypothetical protein